MTHVRTKDDILLPYMTMAPFPLAFERALEGAICSGLRFERPILDIGCGEGLFAKMVFSEPIDTGIDPNPRELERARSLRAYHELIECRGDRIPKPDGFYRTIFSNSVLEHIADLEPVLREARRLLADDGCFYMTVPTDCFEQYSVVNQVLTSTGMAGAAKRFRKGFNAFWKHYHCYPPDKWQEIVRRCGFRVVQCRTYDPKRICLTNDFLVPFSALGFITKKLFNRWTLLPKVRRVLVYPVYLWARRFLRGGDRAEAGGLVFLALTKSAHD